MQAEIGLQLHGIEENALIYGPGTRYVIWVQGCTLGCKGCWNQNTWNPNAGTWKSNEWILDQIKATSDLEGVTFLGGEPLQQAEALLPLIQNIRDLGLSIFLYTGYRPEEFDETMQACFVLADIAVTGRYIEEQRNTGLRWRGSENQVIHFNTERYQGFELEDGTDVEVTIDHDTGHVTVLGYPDPEIIQEIEDIIGMPLTRRSEF